MKVLFVAKAADSPTTRYRVTPLMEHLEAAGHSTELLANVHGLRDYLALIKAARQVGLVFIQRRLLPGWVLALLRRTGTQLVFDFDDAIFARSDGQPSASRLRAFRRTINAAALAVAGNDFLAAQVPLDKRLVIPTPVSASVYPQRSHVGPLTTLIWIGSRSTSRYLEDHRDELNAVGRALPGLRLLVVADFQFALADLDVLNISWSQESERDALARADVGIAPMIDNDWTRGKCALKVLQYMAAGLPVVSSDVGANAEVIVAGETGFLATGSAAWCEALITLQAPEARQRMGSAGYARLCTDYAEAVLVARLVRELEARALLAPVQ